MKPVPDLMVNLVPPVALGVVLAGGPLRQNPLVAPQGIGAAAGVLRGRGSEPMESGRKPQVSCIITLEPARGFEPLTFCLQVRTLTWGYTERLVTVGSSCAKLGVLGIGGQQFVDQSVDQDQ